MANQNQSQKQNQNRPQQQPQQPPQQNMIPVDPFTMMMWGPPPGAHAFMPGPQQQMQPVQQNGGQVHQAPESAAQPNFFNANGGFDFNKLMDGADKMVKLTSQIQPMLKQLGPLFNLFK